MTAVTSGYPRLSSGRRGGTHAARSALASFWPAAGVDPVGLETAKAAGILCGRAGTSDVAGATVVVMAAAAGAVIWTSGPADIKALADESGSRPAPSSAQCDRLSRVTDLGF